MNSPLEKASECGSHTEGVEHLAGLARKWAYARASEASTLFIPRSVAGSPPYLQFFEKPGSCWALASFDGRALDEFVIRRVERSGEDRTLFLESSKWPEAEKITFLLYPYRDIDDTWVVIQDLPDREEKPVRFALPAHLAHRIEVMPDGYP